MRKKYTFSAANLKLIERMRRGEIISSAEALKVRIALMDDWLIPIHDNLFCGVAERQKEARENQKESGEIVELLEKNHFADIYKERMTVETDRFSVSDASTFGGERAHDDVIWVSVGKDGVWMKPEEAEEFAQALTKVVASHLQRKKS